MLQRYRALSLVAVAAALVAAPALAQEKQQATFASPEEAVKAVVAAARSENTQELVHIFGASARPLIASGDPVEDRDGRKQFVERADHQVQVTGDAHNKTVFVGRNHWPLPFPLISHEGRWYFDSRQGRREVLERRIGQNEIEAMLVCRAIGAAEQSYFQVDRNGDGIREYSTRFRSRPGEKNGLYWDAKAGQPSSPLGPLIARAESEGYAGHLYHAPYHGYFFKIMQAQGAHALGGAHSYLVNGHMLSGYAVLAYPAHWSSSGVMTFILNQDGRLYERNLGPHTSEIVPKIETYDPDRNWHLVKE